MRNRRFVAVHRGGSLSIEHHRQLTSWAADCAEHVLPIFAACNADERPHRAVEAARAWAKGVLSVGNARNAAFEAHSAARGAVNDAAIAAARATGHAAATAHMADHSLGAAEYALKAVEATGISSANERVWQDEHLPADIRELVLSTREERRRVGKNLQRAKFPGRHI
jgi:hypothetical protein